MAAASGALIWAERQPGSAGIVPERAPAWVAPLNGGATLIVALHPRCPCSRATLANLQRLLVDTPCSVVAVLYRPARQPADWAEGTKQQILSALPGARTLDDPDGALAAQLGAKTSGHVVLCGADGRVLFSGGVTAARGHEGDNAALQTLRSLIVNPPPVGAGLPRAATTTVFGCSLSAGEDAACQTCTPTR